MTENVQHAPLKVDGQIVGLASVDFREEGAVIFMKINHTEAGRKVWDMLNDDEYGYSLNDEAMEDEEESDLTFQQDLAQVINRHSRENESGTPDFILAAYLEGCLEMFENATRGRADFRGDSMRIHGVTPRIGIIDEVRLIDFGPTMHGMGSFTEIDSPKNPE